MEIKHYGENRGDEVRVPEGMRLVKLSDLEAAIKYPDDDLRALIGKYL